MPMDEPTAPAHAMTASKSGQLEDRVLSTLNRDGSRRWLYPRLSQGVFLKWRRVVGYSLIVIYNVMPWIEIRGKPSILLDLPRREFTFFGTTFLPTDTLLLMLFLASIFICIFLVTALFGRLWCGWACPQTVWMELVYRPIERFFDGSPEKRRRGEGGATGVRKLLKYLVFLLVSLHLAHTFLAYFVGPETLFQWTTQSPFEHPTSFLIVMATTTLIMFDFCIFREQTCILACPYGRLQSVLLDRNSLTISYDEKRGEPRGKARRARGDVTLPTIGDCVDCLKCVVTCPTGIDIREGLQMECIGCAQCIDACDDVMVKLKRPKGLIRYTSQNALQQGVTRLIRARVVIYPVLLLVLVTTFVIVLTGRDPADITLLRTGGRPYVTLASGEIANHVQIKIVNRSDASRTYSFAMDDMEGARLEVSNATTTVEPGATETVALTVMLPPGVFSQGRVMVHLVVSDDDAFTKSIRCRLQGPWRDRQSPDETTPADRAGEDES